MPKSAFRGVGSTVHDYRFAGQLFRNCTVGSPSQFLLMPSFHMSPEHTVPIQHIHQHRWDRQLWLCQPHISLIVSVPFLMPLLLCNELEHWHHNEPDPGPDIHERQCHPLRKGSQCSLFDSEGQSRGDSRVNSNSSGHH